jgi:hypothetical protein
MNHYIEQLLAGTHNLDRLLPVVYCPNILSIEIFEKPICFKPQQGYVYLGLPTWQQSSSRLCKSFLCTNLN